jgi:hypothetical protein
MSKQEFLKKAVRNMDRDVEYDPNSDKDAKKSDGVKETGPTNFNIGDTEGRFN